MLDEFVVVMWKDVLKGVFMKDYMIVDGKLVMMEDFVVDVEFDYCWFYVNY